MIPVALLCTLAFKCADVKRLRFEFRVGMAVSSIVIFLWAGFSWWFKTSIWELGLVLGTYVFLPSFGCAGPK